MQRLMLATDFSERSDRALRRAVLLARAHGAILDLVHVVDDDRPRRIVDHEAVEARNLLRELAQSLRSGDGITCATQIVLSDPFVGISQAVDERKPDLLVIGPHRRQILKDAFMGTTAERTIRSVDCPVVMVNGPPVGSWRHVMLTTDLSEHAKNAIDRFAELGIATEARRSVLLVFDAVALRIGSPDLMTEEDRESYLEDQRRAARSDLARFMGDIAALPAELVVRHDATTTANEIHKAAKEIGADLIVVSSQGKGALARIVLGSVAEKVLQSATVDVLVMPTLRPA
jgi:nucleotide-binding universal stress UspA family protein